MKAEISRPMIARNRIGRMSAISLRTSIDRLLSKTSAGRKTKMMISDVRSKLSKLCSRSLTGPRWASCAALISRPRMIPTTASSTVYGNL
jgi:hypothetical protein